MGRLLCDFWSADMRTRRAMIKESRGGGRHAVRDNSVQSATACECERQGAACVVLQCARRGPRAAAARGVHLREHGGRRRALVRGRQRFCGRTLATRSARRRVHASGHRETDRRTNASTALAPLRPPLVQRTAFDARGRLGHASATEGAGAQVWLATGTIIDLSLDPLFDAVHVTAPPAAHMHHRLRHHHLPMLLLRVAPLCLSARSVCVLGIGSCAFVGVSRSSENRRQRRAEQQTKPNRGTATLSAALGRPQVVAPGVAHADTIRAFHSAKFMEHACAQNCVLDVR